MYDYVAACTVECFNYFRKYSSQTKWLYTYYGLQNYYLAYLLSFPTGTFTHMTLSRFRWSLLSGVTEFGCICVCIYALAMLPAWGSTRVLTTCVFVSVHMCKIPHAFVGATQQQASWHPLPAHFTSHHELNCDKQSLLATLCLGLLWHFPRPCHLVHCLIKKQNKSQPDILQRLQSSHSVFRMNGGMKGPLLCK